jgi:hypothetical protein
MLCEILCFYMPMWFKTDKDSAKPIVTIFYFPDSYRAKDFYRVVPGQVRFTGQFMEQTSRRKPGFHS